MCPNETQPVPVASSAGETLTESHCHPAGFDSTTPPALDCSSPPSGTTDQSCSNPSPLNLDPYESEQVPLHLIVVDDEANGRETLDREKVKALARSIHETGLLHPITVRRRGATFALIAGRHRLGAFAELGWTDIPAKVIEADDKLAAIIRLTENCNRSSLSPIEEAWGCAAALESDPDGVDSIAHSLGRSVSWVLDRLVMTQWDEELQTHVHHGRLSIGAAKCLARITDDKQRAELTRFAATNGINASTAAQWLADANRDDAPIFVASEKQAGNVESAFQTVTTVECFRCKERAELSTTLSTHICAPCLRELVPPAIQPPTDQPTTTNQQPATEAPPPS